MEDKFPKGSEWRKWDLHLHSPGTKLNNQYKKLNADVWDIYCRKLHESDVQAFGITDYFSVDGYFNTVKEYRKRFPDCPKVFFPNIELRTSYVVNNAQEEVNIHLIFNRFQPNFQTEIKKFLYSLNTNKTNKNGLNVRVSELSTERDFEEATTNREFIQNALTETYGRDADFLDYLLIVTAANNDGIRSIPGKKRKESITDELDKLSDGFFGNSRNVDYFLKSDRAEDETELTPPKPVISGCDAHSFDDIDNRLGKVITNSDGVIFEPTWIKADLTFEGLKQITFEPENRVFIGEEPEVEKRVREQPTKFIEKLYISNAKGYRGQHGTWFSDENVLLGKELVAIIGNKGSGKSAVTDIIGLLGNSHNQKFQSPARRSEELFSFLNKDKFLKKNCAQNFFGELSWYDGETDNKELNSEVARTLPEKVEYLPQKYLERICTDIEDDEFRTTLNEVIFRYVKPEQRFAQSNLDELIKYLTQEANKDLQDNKSDLNEINQRIVALEKKLIPDYLETIKGEIHLKKQELNAHKNAKPIEIPSPPEESDESIIAATKDITQITVQITNCNEEIARLEDEKIETTKLLENLRQFKHAIQREASKLTGLKTEYQSVLEIAGLTFDNLVMLKLDFNELDSLVNRKYERFVEIENLLLTPEQIAERFGEQSVNQADRVKAESKSIVCRKANLEEQKIKLTQKMAKPQHDYQIYREELSAWKERKYEILGSKTNPTLDSLRGLKNELQRISSDYPTELQSEREEQKRVSQKILHLKRELIQFYDNIKQSIDSEIKKFHDELGDYTISIEAGLRFDSSFIYRFLQFINQGVRGSFHGVDEGTAMIQRICGAVDDWENEIDVFNALDEIVEALHIDKRMVGTINEGEIRNVFNQMKNQNEPVVELYDYLFGFDYLETKYDLKVDQKDLSELSPGERGGLLLIFYLMLDRRNIPLVIDQPEDNLDNKSVYEILVTFIKKAKKHRQIILVTHNPNLAVVADAEQIIRVAIDKTNDRNDFDYFSGSIENPKINRAVVEILEGTLPAFDNRRLKYRRQN